MKTPKEAVSESTNTNPSQKAIPTKLVKDQCEKECEPISNENDAHSERVSRVTNAPPDNLSSQTESNSEVNSAANDKGDNVATNEVNRSYIDDEPPNLHNESRTDIEHKVTGHATSTPSNGHQNLTHVTKASPRQSERHMRRLFGTETPKKTLFVF
ncbi:unnamed protein product [Lepeophtheirus salmonis]|uniref:(salmon louse) hypothetical protein n=1 Tax=Lepeophtheirus salmonis TaxID=72036 RepID=A0A7R8CRG1_LEPSM|nr:unnamed protein product [Lepeophtheirus salmonis]CAF2903187.1 unnamed protein product [Lepeophtheirus salmonis]